MAKAKGKGKKNVKAAAPAPVVPASLVTKSQQVEALSRTLLLVRAKRFEIDQKRLSLTDAQRTALMADYDAARDAYYKGVAEFIDSGDQGVALIVGRIGEANTSMEALLVNQQNVAKVLDAISSAVGLAGKLVALGGV